MICCCSPPNHRLDSYETLLVSGSRCSPPNHLSFSFWFDAHRERTTVLLRSARIKVLKEVGLPNQIMVEVHFICQLFFIDSTVLMKIFDTRTTLTILRRYCINEATISDDVASTKRQLRWCCIND